MKSSEVSRFTCLRSLFCQQVLKGKFHPFYTDSDKLFYCLHLHLTDSEKRENDRVQVDAFLKAFFVRIFGLDSVFWFPHSAVLTRLPGAIWVRPSPTFFIRHAKEHRHYHGLLPAFYIDINWHIFYWEVSRQLRFSLDSSNIHSVHS